MVAIKRVLESKVAAEAEERMKTGKLSSNFPQGKTRDIVADYVGVSGKTLEKAKA